MQSIRIKMTSAGRKNAITCYKLVRGQKSWRCPGFGNLLVVRKIKVE